MTKTEIKTKLQNYAATSKEVRSLRSRLETMRESVGATAVSSDGMPHGSGRSDPTAGKAMALANLEATYDAAIAKRLQEVKEVEDLIAELEPTERVLARYRYIDDMSWEEICVVMSYSWRQVHRIHSRLLDHLASMA